MINEKRVNHIFKTLRPYINGKLITTVFVRYFNELEAIIKTELKTKLKKKR